jgi:RNA polymerase sigma factor (sigma-70 family)
MEHTRTTLAHSITATRYRDDSQASFISLYDAYFSRVYNYIRYRSTDADTADDLTAIVFEKALYNFHRFQPDRGPFGPWLFGIARNIVNSHLRIHRRQLTTSLEDLDNQPDDHHLPEASLIIAETSTELLASLDALNERERDLLSLKFAARLTNRRIAEITELSETNVSVIIYRALKKLRRQLSLKE